MEEESQESHNKFISSDIGESASGETEEGGLGENNFQRTTFVFAPPSWWREVREAREEPSPKIKTKYFPLDRERDLAVDEEGDCDVPRKRSQARASLTLEHHTSSTLGEVGLQVWRGALFLADYLLQCPEYIQGRRVLDVGAGTGLTSIVSAQAGAALTLATDIGACLPQLERNVELNIPGYLDRSLFVMPMDVRSTRAIDHVFERAGSGGVDTILMADLFYDDGLTRALFKFLARVVKEKIISDVRILISIERRVVFTLEKLEECAPAYDLFKEELEDFIQKLAPRKLSSIREVTSEEVPQYFSYQSRAHMNLVDILITA